MSNRIKQAWLALTGRLQPEVREVVKEVTLLGTPEPVTLYAATRDVYYAYGGGPYSETVGLYRTCEQAHKEHPSRKVIAKKYWRIGEAYFSGLQVEIAKVQPKPKRTKGIPVESLGRAE